MAKKLLTLFTLFFIFSCQSELKKEMVKSGKSGASADRINSSEQNSKDVFKELD